MELVQSRIVTDDVQRLAAFYARLVRAPAVLNDYYVEVPTGALSVGFSRRYFTEYREDRAARPGRAQHRAEIILDFHASDVDTEYQRIADLGVDWVTPPTTQPWGNRSMIFRDPEGNLINVFSPSRAAPTATSHPALTNPRRREPHQVTAPARHAPCQEGAVPWLPTPPPTFLDLTLPPRRGPPFRLEPAAGGLALMVISMALPGAGLGGPSGLPHHPHASCSEMRARPTR